jgi:hypothetical protein
MRLAIAAAFLLLVFGCGNLEGPRTGTISPPTDALARWNDFPADQVPRPIVLLGYHPPGQGFDTGDAKIAYLCGKLALVAALPVEVPAQAVASWADGTKYTYPALSATDAFAAFLRSGSKPSSSMCSTVAPLPVTAARFGVAGFSTDRGTAQMSAWIFKVTGAWAEAAQPAVSNSAIWGGGVTQQSLTSGASTSSTGRVLTFNFVGGPPDGPCGVNYTGVVAESSHAVAVAVESSPGRVEGGPLACTGINTFRTVTVQLASQLGGRVLVDAAGAVVGVSPPPVL